MSTFSSQNPYKTRILKRHLFNKSPSTKKSYFISLDLKNSGIEFTPGDSVAILPMNDPKIVDHTIISMKANANDEIVDPKTNEKMSLFDFLSYKANISKTPAAIIKMLEKNISKEDMIKLINSHHLWDFLKKYPKHKLSASDITSNLMPLLPRLYSAASSMKMFPEEVQLIITHVSYELGGIERNGVCTEFVCHLAKTNQTQIPIYTQQSHGFYLPKDPTIPIIMIGPGCGIAPFRAFLQERFMTKATGKNWLFFGERNKDLDYYFQDFFEDLESKNFLRLTTAFSRDQEDKIYVQNRLYENASDIWQWIQHGAYFYVCGDAKTMARDVDKVLHQICIEQGNMSEDESKAFVKNLIKEKRYLKDIY